MNQSSQIFLCYARQDEKLVKEIYERLTKAGFKPWMDIFNLTGGVKWKTEIEKAIKTSQFFFVCLSKNTIDKRGFIQQEISSALDIMNELPPEGIFIIPVRLEDCNLPEKLTQYQWIDYFKSDGWERVIKSLYKVIEPFEIVETITLRSTPISNLNEHQAEMLIKKFGFTDLRKNRISKGIKHHYELIERRKGKLVIDHATKLIWQQSGSDKIMTFIDAKNYIEELNKHYFGEHKEWRLPTLEEAMSLMESEVLNENLYINSLFDSKQWGIWTIDMKNNENVWTVDFDYGFCGFYPNTNMNYVRAVLP